MERIANFQNEVYEKTPTLDTSAYASGDLLFDTTAIDLGASFASTTGPVRMEVVGIQGIDAADQKQPFTLLFLNANQSLGTVNSAPDVSDANALKVIGQASVIAEDYKDLGDAACFQNPELLPVPLQLAAGSRYLYLAGLSEGTGTYGAASITLRIAIRFLNVPLS